MINENRIEVEQEVQLYLMILEQQGKLEEILQVLSGHLAIFLSQVPQRKAKLLLKMKSYEKATRAYEELIRKE